ncbi:MAG: SDR family NAD(P)-dependent oxidoreductase [Aeromicrobium sp.]
MMVEQLPVVLVTGSAGRGIGQATIRRLAKAGASVVITDVHPQRTAAVTEDVTRDHPNTHVLGRVMDVRDRDQIDAVLAEVTAELGPVTVLVNNAAVNYVGSIFDYDPALWDETLKVNITGPWYVSSRVFAGMRDAGGGVIINVSSYAADVGGAGLETPYAVSKGALNTLTRCLAHEGGPFGIRANTVTLGMIAGTKYVDDNAQLLERHDAVGPLGSLATVAEVAETIAFLTSDAARHITGETINIAGGAYMRN